MGSDLLIRSIRLAAAPAVMAPLERFYVGCLGFGAETGGGLTLEAGGGDRVAFAPSPDGGQPFYHFALLVPGDRYLEARTWAAQCAELLSRPGQASTTFRFDAWDADACYFHDPAGNIVELIAHRGVGEGRAVGGEFTAGELLGISEIGMVVTDPPAAARTLAAARVELWSGGVEGAAALGFVGRQARTLILCAPGRPWLPTQRPAECQPVTVSLAGDDAVTIDVTDGVLSATAGR